MIFADNIILNMRRIADGSTLISALEKAPLAALNPSSLCVELAVGARAQLVILHTKANTATIDIKLGQGAQLEVAQLFMAEAFAEISVLQDAKSQCNITSIELSSANATYTIDLNGEQAHSKFSGLFFASADDHCVAHLRTNHNAPDCTSDSFYKGVAGGCALGEFGGMVYVAKDAQRTDARQQSRNILLSATARIIAQPQLEIYADDVKCSHGATVGQMDSDAILYMRQRGLSESQARRLQIEGFIGDIIGRCMIEPFVEAVLPLANQKMEIL